jgi:2,3-bisphosphoglycerate-independent phosphoglycerate mutase
MAQSPRDVSTYDQKPEMSAADVMNFVLKEIDSGRSELLIVNFANGDMVGHTGVLEAAVKAVQTVDACVGKIVDATLKAGGSLVITADHGNCEQMINPETGGPHTAHTTYDVPLIVVEPGLEGKKLREGGRLADIAPTVLALMGLEKPSEMTGESLLISS